LKISPATLPDLIVSICPFGCNGTCQKVWLNETIDHRIICKCKKCNHNKKRLALAEVEGPEANAHMVRPSEVRLPTDD